MRRRSKAPPTLPEDRPHVQRPAEPGVLRSPYIFGVPIRNRRLFTGRQEVMDEVEGLLRPAPGGEKRDVVLVGRRRIGKTSILIHLGEQVARHGFLPVQVSLERLEHTSLPGLQDELIEALTDKIREVCVDDRMARLELWMLSVLRYLRTFRFGLRWMFVNVYQQSKGRDNSFERDLVRLVELVLRRAAAIRYVLVMIDDVHLLRSFESPGALAYLRGLIQDSRLNDVNFVVTGTDLARVFAGGDSAQLYDLFTVVRVGGIARAAAQRLVTEPIAGQDVEFSAGALDLVLELTSCIPYWLQCLCHHLVEVLNVQRKRSVGEIEVRQALARLILHETSLLGIWEELRPNERYALAIIAHLQAPAAWSKLVELSQGMGHALSRTETLELLSRLSTLGILHWEGQTFEVADNIFLRWVRDTKRPEDLRPAPALGEARTT
jgi:hypothetical protein